MSGLPIKGPIKGWCPGALRPMETGDGLILRIRPHGGRLSADQARALADLAQTHGNGLIDLGSRAHLQLRGVAAAALPALHDALAGLGLLDPDPAAEARRNILTSPVWTADDPTQGIVAALAADLASGPDLPAKFGFAVDTGAAAVLGTASADIRIERAAAGLILRAEGMALGQPVSAAQAAGQAVALARWFAAHAGDHRRMGRAIAAGAVPPLTATTPPVTAPPLRPGLYPQGLCLGLPFGQMTAATLRHLAVAPLRLTPWRSVLVEGLRSLPALLTAADPGLITAADDPLLRVTGCTGAPGCASASVTTRDLARALAPLVPPGGLLHVSGCAKGCAHPAPAPLTLTGRDGRFDLILNAAPDAAPARTDLTATQIPQILRDHLAPPL